MREGCGREPQDCDAWMQFFEDCWNLWPNIQFAQLGRLGAWSSALAHPKDCGRFSSSLTWFRWKIYSYDLLPFFWLPPTIISRVKGFFCLSNYLQILLFCWALRSFMIQSCVSSSTTSSIWIWLLKNVFNVELPKAHTIQILCIHRMWWI